MHFHLHNSVFFLLQARLYGRMCQHTKSIWKTLYMIRKRPKEELYPTLWEIPLQPLPKRHKVHWDPNEWDILVH